MGMNNMPKFRSRKFNIVYERCDVCGKYSSLSDGKNYYCGEHAKFKLLKNKPSKLILKKVDKKA